MVATLLRGRDSRCCRKWLMFVLVALDWSPHICKARYRRRFGIEHSYRQGRQVRIITNSMNPALRLLLHRLVPGLGQRLDRAALDLCLPTGAWSAPD